MTNINSARMLAANAAAAQRMSRAAQGSSRLVSGIRGIHQAAQSPLPQTQGQSPYSGFDANQGRPLGAFDPFRAGPFIPRANPILSAVQEQGIRGVDPYANPDAMRVLVQRQMQQRATTSIRATPTPPIRTLTPTPPRGILSTALSPSAQVERLHTLSRLLELADNRAFLEAKGIFRLSANALELNKAKANKEDFIRDVRANPSKLDPHLLAGVLKHSLSESITEAEKEAFLKSLGIDITKLNSLTSLTPLQKMYLAEKVKRTTNASTPQGLQKVLSLAAKVVKAHQYHPTEGKMTAKNLAIIFAPTLYPKDAPLTLIAELTLILTKAMESLIQGEMERTEKPWLYDETEV